MPISEKTTTVYHSHIFFGEIINMNNNIEIVFITDSNFILPTLVAIQSLFLNRNKNRVYKINLVLHNYSFDIKYLDKFKNKNFKFNIINLNQNFEFFKKEGFPVSPSAIYKFMLPSILDVDKVLYLDVDILIQSDLTELYDIELKNKYACVVKDYHGLTFKGDVFERLKIEKREGYFNSGMMLLNLSLLRKDNIQNKLFDYRKNGINYYMDQDALNVILGENVKFVDFKFNTTLTNVRNKTSKELSSYYNINFYEDKYEYIQKSDIVHFSSDDKPWIFFDSLFSDIWFYYYSILETNTILKRKSLNDTIPKKDTLAKTKRIQNELYFKKNLFSILEKRNDTFPLVSIIIACYNCEKTISETLDSCINQTVKKLEIICVDDGSTDNTLRILKNYANKDQRIKIIQQKNQYAGTARNNALTQAKGMYITFIDSDDIFSKYAIEKFYLSAVSTGADIVCCNTYRFQDDLNTLEKTNFNLRDEYIPLKNSFYSESIQQFIFNFTTGGVGGKFFNHKFIKINKLKFSLHPKSEDLYFIHLGLLISNLITIIKDPLYYIRTLDSSLEHTKSKHPLAFYDASIELKKKIISIGLFNNQVKQSFINVLVDRFAYNLKTVNDDVGYKKILDKFLEIFNSELSLRDNPPKYYYKAINYNYLIKLLSLKNFENFNYKDEIFIKFDYSIDHNNIHKINELKREIFDLINNINFY